MDTNYWYIGSNSLLLYRIYKNKLFLRKILNKIHIYPTVNMDITNNTIGEHNRDNFPRNDIILIQIYN